MKREAVNFSLLLSPCSDPQEFGRIRMRRRKILRTSIAADRAPFQECRRKQLHGERRQPRTPQSLLSHRRRNDAFRSVLDQIRPTKVTIFLPI